MTDLRVAKSKRAIQTSFIALLAEKELEKITVAELVRRAEVGRGTFYLHYQDIYDLFEQMEADIARQVVHLVKETAVRENFLNYRSMLQILADFIQDNAAFLTLFKAKRHSLFSRINHDLLDMLLTDFPQDYQTDFDLIETQFMMAGLSGILEEALIQQRDLSTLIDDLNRILLKFEGDEI